MIEFDLSLFFLVGGLYLEELINGGAYFQNFPLLASHFADNKLPKIYHMEELSYLVNL